jgi:tetratricopeptide (TPR) repeat protein
MNNRDDLYSAILAEAPSPSTLLIVCQRMKEEGNVSDALRGLIRGISLYPDDTRLRQCLSECYLELGFISLAEQEMIRITGQIERLVPVYKTLGNLFERQGRDEKAVLALEKYLAHFPDDREAVERLRSLKEKEDVFPTRTQPPKEIVPEIATHTLAEIYEGQGQLQAAIDTYKKLVEKDPEDFRARERMQQLHDQVYGKEETPEPVAAQPEGRERMITVLEGWLARMQEIRSV